MILCNACLLDKCALLCCKGITHRYPTVDNSQKTLQLPTAWHNALTCLVILLTHNAVQIRPSRAGHGLSFPRALQTAVIAGLTLLPPMFLQLLQCASSLQCLHDKADRKASGSYAWSQSYRGDFAQDIAWVTLKKPEYYKNCKCSTQLHQTTPPPTPTHPLPRPLGAVHT